jgi:molecular chaperone DnaJ
LKLPVTFPEAALGADVKVPTLDGQVTVRIPPGTASGKVLRVRGKGVEADGRAKNGDLLVTVDVQVPVNVSGEQRAAIEQIAQVLNDDPRAALFAQAQGQHRRKGDQ